ncbi:uncharacterized protein LOC143059206 [Mytilus galloprovincialis]|uniref:uncharacterized protein LOC143059206 n=1 Tax=Mytilus galloprovincialis TaxID=29158 RepID=UPI003F7C3C5E
MKCDIEISVTAEDEEYDTIEIPQCLRESTVEPMSSVVKQNDLVCLPDRYANKLRKSSENSEITNGHFGNDLVSREKDLSTALKWIKQEILQMKEQDRSLMKQFIDLRSTIVQLRCMYEFQSSNSDISSLSGSNYSLDESYRHSPPLRHGLNGHLEVEGTEFRARTSSLLTPRRSNITHIKWRSNEYI